MVDPGVRNIRVEVVFAEADQVFLRTLSVPCGTMAWDAVIASGLLRERPDVAVGPDNLGVFGQRVAGGRILDDGDRVEVYRPLAVDPMSARRRRAGGAGRARR